MNNHVYQLFNKLVVVITRFISRMKARPKHLSCIAISSFHLAACQWVERVNSINGIHSDGSTSNQSTLQVCTCLIYSILYDLVYLIVCYFWCRLQNRKIWS